MKSKMLGPIAFWFIHACIVSNGLLIFCGHLTSYVELSDTNCMILAVVGALTLAGTFAMFISYETLELADLGCDLHTADKIEIACSALYSLPLLFVWDKALPRAVVAAFGVTDAWWDPAYACRGVGRQNHWCDISTASHITFNSFNGSKTRWDI